MLHTLVEDDTVTNKDLSVIQRLLKVSHNSLGSYHMLAATRAPHMVGFNHVHKSSPDDWPDHVGRHAEVHLCSKYDVKGKTVYVVGRNSSGSIMRNTKPCRMCRKTLINSGARRVVYFHNGNIISKSL